MTYARIVEDVFKIVSTLLIINLKIPKIQKNC